MHPIRPKSKGWNSQTGEMCGSLFLHSIHQITEESKDSAKTSQVADVMITPAIFKLIKCIFSCECLSGWLPLLSASPSLCLAH